MNQNTGNTLVKNLNSGLGTRILAGVLVVVISAAAIGAWSVSMNLSAVEATLRNIEKNFVQIEKRFDRLDNRIIYMEQKLDDQLKKRILYLERQKEGENK